MVAAANRALADDGRSERFFRIETGDQTAMVVFGDGEPLRAVLREFHIAVLGDEPVGSGPEAAR